ncbi:HEAT repeat domain-containing protein [Anabaena azotica]|uniref:HEAT repeat domain-containing protein n=1 Tax=Anabaena azotica TaxID=197653 RepID=UPI0039A4BB55
MIEEANNNQPNSRIDHCRQKLELIGLIIGIPVALITIIKFFIMPSAKLEIVDFQIDNKTSHPEVQIKLLNKGDNIAFLKGAELKFTKLKISQKEENYAAEVKPKFYDWLISNQDIEKKMSYYPLSRKIEVKDADYIILKIGLEKLHAQIEGDARLSIYYDKNKKIDADFTKKITIRNYAGEVPKFSMSNDSRELVTQLGLTKTPYTIEEIISELRQRKYEPAIPSIRKYLNYSEPEVRAAAAAYFSQLKDREVIPKLANSLKDNNPYVRKQVSQALIFQAEESLDELEKQMNSGEPTIREIVVNILGNIKNQRSEMLLLKAIDDRGVTKVISGEEVLISASAIRALAKIHSKHLSDRIVQLLNDDNLSVKLAALDATETLKLKKAIPKLVKMLDSPENRIRKKAHQVLIHLTDLDYNNSQLN